jgi:tetratricopeptide (TPR) repeat protein
MNSSESYHPSPPPAAVAGTPTPALLEPRSPRLAAVALLLLVCLAYVPVVRDEFIWDDDAYVTHNGTLRSVEGLRRMWLEPLSIPQYYPLVHTTFWIEYHLWGLHPLGYHIVNVALHAISAVLLWRLLLRIGAPGAWLAAAIFAVHPVCVESVVWVTERKNVLSLALVLSSMLAYLRFAPVVVSADDAPHASGAGRWGWYALSWFLFFAALLSKSVVATMPAVLLVIIWWKRGRLGWRDVLPLLPFFAIGGLLGLHTATLERTHVGAEGEEWNFSPAERGLIAGRAVWFYARKLVWPYPLIFFYHRWHIDDHQWWQYSFPVAALGLVAGLWLARSKIGRGPLAAALIFGGVLMPAIGFFNVYPFRYSFVADHFQYHASLALITLAAAGAALWAQRLTASGRTALSASAAVVLVLLGALTFRQTMIYENLEVLYRDVIAKNGTAVIAYSNLATHLGNLGRNEEGLELIRKAVEIDPQAPGVHNNLGAILLTLCMQTGERGKMFDECIRELEYTLQLNPRYTAAHSNLAVAMVTAKKPEVAITHLRRALELNPRDARSMFGMGSLLRLLKKNDEARTWYLKALERDPDMAQAHYGLGLELAESGATDAAIQHWETALRIDPRYTDAHYALANALSARGEYAQAVEHYRAAIELRPKFVAALVNLGIAQLNLGDASAAVQSFEETLQVDPDNGEANFTLALALAKAGRLAEAAERLQAILAADPNRADAQFQLGNIFVAQEKMPEAIESYSEAVRLRPDYFEALQNLGAALLIVGKTDEAIPRLEEVLRLQPDNPQARANLEEARRRKSTDKPADGS